MSNFPSSLDDSSSLPNPSSTSKTNNPPHAALHSAENAAIISVQEKVGIGSSTPVANTVLKGMGTGESEWGGLTSAELAAILSDETGSGKVVFATSPALITPKVDTINENTPGNGVTVDGVNLKDGKVATPNAVDKNALAPESVTSDSFNTDAGEIGGALNTWTPTFTNISGGTLNYAKYWELGKIGYFRLKYTFGGSASVTGNMELNTPSLMQMDTPSASTDVFDVRVEFFDTSASRAYPGGAAQVDEDTLRLFAFSTSTNPLSYTSTGSSSPFSWGNGDYFIVSGHYVRQ